MKKIKLMVLMVVLMLLTQPIAAKINLDVEHAYVTEGRTYFEPSEYEKLGLVVEEKGNTAILTGLNVVLEFTLGNVQAKVNGVDVYMDKKITSRDGKLMLPMRFILETLGYKVGWEKGAYTFARELDVRYPISFERGGENTLITKTPTRIVSGSPAFTQILIDLGEKDAMVGQSGYGEDIEEASDIKVVVPDMMNPDIEKIVSVKPDAVFMITGEAASAVMEKLRSAGIEVFAEPMQHTMEDVYQYILDTGRIMDKEFVARAIISGMKAQITTTRFYTKRLSKPSVYYSLSAGEFGEYTSPQGSYMNDLMEAAGVENVAAANDTWEYTTELIVKQNPSIIYASTWAYDTITGGENYRTIDAVKNKKVYKVDDNTLGRPTASMVRVGLKQLLKAAHPEVLEKLDF
ncbi:MAG: ABC transporter substrate-binding protein [Tissierellia bacterium]|nr:ABC transporter substrate-binding protein [Tissierellia bacterium]